MLWPTIVSGYGLLFYRFVIGGAKQLVPALHARRLRWAGRAGIFVVSQYAAQHLLILLILISPLSQLRGMANRIVHLHYMWACHIYIYSWISLSR
jgi:hypothetical protein